MTHICVSEQIIIGSYNGLSPGRHQAIIGTSAGILLIWRSGTKFNEILMKIHTFSFKKMHLIRSPAKWWPFCIGLNVLNGKTVSIHCRTSNAYMLTQAYIYIYIYICTCIPIQNILIGNYLSEAVVSWCELFNNPGLLSVTLLHATIAM